MNLRTSSHSCRFRHKSFYQDKNQTLSTGQTSYSPSKSFISIKSRSKTIQITKPQPAQESIPIQIYFNPQFRGTYIKKVIDTFFIIPQQMKQKDNKSISLRTKIKQNKKSNLVPNFIPLTQSKFIRSNPIQQNLSQLNSNQIDLNQQNLSLYKQSLQSSTQYLFLNKNLSQKDNQNYHENNHKTYRPFTQQKSRNSTFVENITSKSIFFNQGNSPRDKIKRQVTKLILQNQYFKQYQVYQAHKKIKIIRKYVQSYNQSTDLYQRELKIIKKGIKTIWTSSKLNRTLQRCLLKPLSQTMSYNLSYGSSPDKHIQIHPSPYYSCLFLNKNQQLNDLITFLTKFIINNKGKLLTNLTLNNIYRQDEKDFLLGDLGRAAMVEEFRISNRNVRFMVQPIVRHQLNCKDMWLIRPEYMSPELLQSYRNNDYMWIKNDPTTVIASQIWSLGCTLLEALTLIPLNSDIRCRVRNNPQTFRRGFLDCKFNGKNNLDFELLRSKQSSLNLILIKTLDRQLSHVGIQKYIIQIVKKMLIFNPKDRIKPQQILNLLKI